MREGATLALFENDHEKDPGASQWFTPPWLAKRLVDWCGSPKVHRLLEPSAGSGRLVDAVRHRWPFAIVDTHETDPRWADVLRLKRKDILYPQDTLRVREHDFLASPTPPEPYDLAVMNPPFENGQDLAFLRHAMRCSKRIVMVCRLGFVANKGTRRAVAEAGWSWVGIASLGRVRFDGAGDTSPLSDFAAIKLTSEPVFDAPTFEWWEGP